MCCLSCFISFWCERNECRFSNDSLSLFFSGSINGLATRNVSCANGSHLWNCFQQEMSNKNNDWERATAQRITTLTNMADVGRGASCWRVCHMMTPMGQERVYRIPGNPLVHHLFSSFLDYGSCQMWSRMSARLGIVWRAIKTKMSCKRLHEMGCVDTSRITLPTVILRGCCLC